MTPLEGASGSSPLCAVGKPPGAPTPWMLRTFTPASTDCMVCRYMVQMDNRPFGLGALHGHLGPYTYISAAHSRRRVPGESVVRPALSVVPGAGSVPELGTPRRRTPFYALLVAMRGGLLMLHAHTCLPCMTQVRGIVYELTGPSCFFPPLRNIHLACHSRGRKDGLRASPCCGRGNPRERPLTCHFISNMIGAHVDP